MQVWKYVTLAFDKDDEDVLRRFAGKKLEGEKDIDLVHTIVENIVYAIDNDSKSKITDINLKYMKGNDNV